MAPKRDSSGRFVSSGPVLKALSNLGKKYVPDHRAISYIVGYTANYALHVHENMEASHKVGNAKFLTKPLQENKDRISQTIVAATKKTKSLNQGVLMGGMLLQRLSQQQVPVDTGNLKNSAFTRKG